MALIDDPRRLSRLVSIGFDKMTTFRNARMKMLTQYVSRFYGYRWDDDNPAVTPINLIYQAAMTMIPNLVYNDPKSKISTNYLAYRFYADVAGLAINHLIREVNMRHSLRQMITDAIFLAGFAKSGLGVSGQTLDLDGFTHNLGQPYWDRVDPDDMVLDPVARTWEEQEFIGNRYRVSKEFLVESGLYDEKQVQSLVSRYQTYSSSASGFDSEGKEASMLSMKSWTGGEADHYSDSIELVDVWLPDHQAIVTMPWRMPHDVRPEIIRQVEWEGPESGPYQMLGFAFVPDNILPVAPAMIWYDLHIMTNKIARKLADQAERNKVLLAYEPAAWEDADEIKDSEDGETVAVEDIDRIKEVAFGGATDDTYQYVEWAKQQFSEMAMNIDLLSGTGSDEPTATQAEMVQANTSIRLADMQHMVYHFAQKGMENLFFYLHTDPLIEIPLIKRTQGFDQQVSYTPEMREGDWSDYHLTVVPFSMARQDPNLKVRRLLDFAGNVIPALTQAFTMIGPAFNLENAINLIGREMGIEELDEIINSPALHQQLGRMQQMLAAGIPMDPKVMKMITQVGQQSEDGQMAALGAQLGQPNPMGQMPAGGVSPQMERNQMAQEIPGELQAAYTA